MVRMRDWKARPEDAWKEDEANAAGFKGIGPQEEARPAAAPIEAVQKGRPMRECPWCHAIVPMGARCELCLEAGRQGA